MNFQLPTQQLHIAVPEACQTKTFIHVSHSYSPIYLTLSQDLGSQDAMSAYSVVQCCVILEITCDPCCSLPANDPILRKYSGLTHSDLN